MSPKAIKKYLDKYIEGQEEAKIAAAVMMYNHMRGIKENGIFVGPSGCGKTEIFRVLADLFPRKIYIYDASSITNDGWSGTKKFNSVFYELYEMGYAQAEIENMLIVFDEFDKLCTPIYSSQGENVHASIQNEFLTMIEGSIVPIDKENEYPPVHTSKISFAFCGAFEDLFQKRRQEKKKIGTIGFSAGNDQDPDRPITMEELVKYGMRTEFAGRIHTLVELFALNREQVRNLLLDPVKSPFVKLAEMYKCDIMPKKEFIEELIDASQDDLRGVRALNSMIRAEINKEIFASGRSDKLSIELWEGKFEKKYCFTHK